MTVAKQKLREFWVGADDRDYFESFISTKNPKDMSGSDDYMYLKDRPLLHLVEKQAYDKLLVRIEKLREGLESIKALGVTTSGLNMCAETAVQILEQDDEAKNE